MIMRVVLAHTQSALLGAPRLLPLPSQIGALRSHSQLVRLTSGSRPVRATGTRRLMIASAGNSTLQLRYTRASASLRRFHTLKRK